MTSSNSGINALIDWSTMTVVKYFSMKDRIEKVEDVGMNYKIRSICYFGGTPQGQLYPFVGSTVIKELHLFSGINRNMLGSIALQMRSYDAHINWINHTSYIYILQENMFGEPSYSFDSYVVNLGPYSLERAIFSRILTKFFNVKFHNSKLLSFDSDITKNEIYDEIYDNLDTFYLFMYTSGNTINIAVPPLYWDVCNSQTLANVDRRMYYGRFRNCGETGYHLGFVTRPNTGLKNDEIFIQYKRAECDEEWGVMHIKNTNNPADWKYGCKERYNLTEKETSLANDNGCHPGFNLDSSGICRQCNLIGYSFTKVLFYPSDCLLWIHFEGVFDDTLTYSYYHYNQSMLNTKFYYKGFTGEEYYYRRIFKEKVDEEGKMISPIEDFSTFLGEVIIRQSKSMLLLKRCYWLLNSTETTPRYQVEVLNGFEMEKISNDPTGQATSQIGLYGGESQLSSYYCSKVCSQGYYYDFDSISCRRCNYGFVSVQKIRRMRDLRAGVQQGGGPKVSHAQGGQGHD